MQYFYTARDPQDHVTVSYTRESTYHDTPDFFQNNTRLLDI